MRHTNMKLHTTEYVHWHGEEGFMHELCDAMNIKPEQFRSYHEVVGGDYKDLWHLWLWYVGVHTVLNGHYSTFYWTDTYGDAEREQLKESWELDNPRKAREEGVDWIIDLFDAIEEVMYNRLEKNEIVIYHYW